MTIIIGEHPLTLTDLDAALLGPVQIELAPSAQRAIFASRETILSLIQRGDPIYGVNTGFGKLATTRIAPADLSALQINIVRSHAAGVGAPLRAPIVRLLMLLKIAALSKGASGISLEAI